MEEVLKNLLEQTKQPAAPVGEARMKKMVLATAVLLSGLLKTVEQIAEAVEQNSQNIDLQVNMRNKSMAHTEHTTELLNKIVLLLSERTPDRARTKSAKRKRTATYTEAQQQEEFAASMNLSSSSLDGIFPNE